jgi:putative SbcD/Mre11-related phosphoesterase
MDRTRLELEPGLWLDARRAVWLEKPRVLAVADLHLGYAWAHRSEGQLLPVHTSEDSTERLLALIGSYAPHEVVLLGDVVHRAILAPALQAELRLLVEAISARARLHIVTGNHDTGLARLLAASGLANQTSPHVAFAPHFLAHGDGSGEFAAAKRLQEIAASGGRVIIGHEHPAIAISDRIASRAKCPCFLVSREVIVLPAFSRWAAGTDVRQHEFLSSFAQRTQFDCAIAILARKLLPVPLRRSR